MSDAKDKSEETVNAKVETEPCGGDRKYYGMMGVASVVCLGILFFVALGFFFHYYGKDATRALWWGIASAFFAILGVGFYVQQYVIWAKPEQRPNVFFKLTALKKPLTVGEKVVIQVALKNSGPTDARVKFWDNTYYFNVAPFKNRFEYIPFPPSSFELTRDAEVNGELRYDFVVTKEKLEALQTDRARLYFFARGEYRDELGQSYPLPFCRMYDKDIAGNLIFCPDDVTIAERVIPKERPELFVEQVVFETLNVGRPEMVSLIIRNRGKITAHNVTLETTHAHKPASFGGPLVYETVPADTHPAICPEGVMTLISQSPWTTTPEHIRSITARIRLLFVYGKGCYDDGVNTSYPIEFCYMFEPSFPRNMVICPDRYCPKEDNGKETA